jgi:CheY-like chemotaxis protein
VVAEAGVFFLGGVPKLGEGGAVKLKILVFDPDGSLLELLRTFLAGDGHEVSVFRDPSVCPLFQQLENDGCRCGREQGCGDVVFMNYRMPQINALDFFKLQRCRGCKLPDANKAVMSASMTDALETAVAEAGCHPIRKPFRLKEIKAWLEECAARLVPPPPEMS